MRKPSVSIFKYIVAVTVIAGLSAHSADSNASSDEANALQEQALSETADAVTAWVRRSGVPLKSLEAGSGFEDLEPLKGLLKDTRIVGLGEATHGTREFFQFKHRMVEFLVREMAFTGFAMEAAHVNCKAINDYVLKGDDSEDPAAVVRSNLAGIWQTQEVLELVKWIRRYNKSVPKERKVKFYGFDVQMPNRAAEAVISYLKRVAPDYEATARRIVTETPRVVTRRSGSTTANARLHKRDDFADSCFSCSAHWLRIRHASPG